MEEIRTERYIMRKIEKTDDENVFKILSDSEVIQNLNMKKHENIEDTRNLIDNYLEELEKGNKYPFAIIDKKTKEFTGVFLIKLDLYDEDCFEFTIYLNKKNWNKGIYTEVLKYMIEFAFETIQTGNFRGFVMEKNEASSKVLERSGFKLEKVFQVEGIEGNIRSYLITKEWYNLIKKSPNF